MMVYNCAKFQNHRAFRKRFTEGGGGIRPPPPAVLGFKKPGLFRVKRVLLLKNVYIWVESNLVS